MEWSEDPCPPARSNTSGNYNQSINISIKQAID